MDGTTLKYLASFLMLIDHIGAVYFPQSQLLRWIGRPAFPLFALLTAEGAVHTHNRKKYFFHLVLFFLISEIPYDLIFFSNLWNLEAQNVLLNFLLGALAIWVMEDRKPLWGLFVTALIFAAHLLRADYGFPGTLFMVLCASCHREDKTTRLATYLAGLLFLALYFRSFEWFCLLAFPLLALYNGQPGSRNRWNKWFFYWFYPVHLIILQLLYPYITAYRIAHRIPF